MQKTYTYVSLAGNKILSRGYYENGERFDIREEFRPTLFTYSGKNAKTDWKDLKGEHVYPIQPGTIRECKEFIEQYKEVEGFDVLDPPSFTSQWIFENFNHDIKFDINHNRIFIVDIETTLDGNDFPNPTHANEEINLLSIWDSSSDKIIVFSSNRTELDHDLLKANNVNPDNVRVYTFAEERYMLIAFVDYWADNHPDIITGWNSNPFDIPYIIRRMEKIGLEDYVKRLSPWGMVWDTSNTYNGKMETKFDIVGVSQLDYLDLMKKFTYGGRESWRLDNIAFEELGRKKLQYEGSFKDFYTNDWNTFVAYNIIDVQLVKDMDAKLRLIELILSLAYETKLNPSDVMSPVKMWDNLIYVYLAKKKIMIPNRKKNHSAAFEGAYVKDPIIGKHKWVASFDLASLYPSIIMGWNMSPETIVDDFRSVTVDSLLNRDVDTSDLPDRNIAMSANGAMFDRTKRGFLPEMMEYFFDMRKIVKKEMLNLKQEFQDTQNPLLPSKISALHNKQMALKIALNSAYGALAHDFFRYYDLRIAEGITLSGQLAIRWVSRDIDIFLNKVCKTTDKIYIIYCDTDSAYINMESIVERHCKSKDTDKRIKFMDQFCDKVLQPVINKSYDDLFSYLNMYEQKLIMKREALASSGLFVKKKKYALLVHNNEGVQYKEPKLKVTGLELVRSSTPAIVKEPLREGVKIVLLKDEAATQAFISKIKSSYNQNSIETISFPRGVNGLAKNTGSPIYAKGCPIHCRASLLYNHYVKKLGLTGKHELIGEGSKMRFVFLKMPNPIHENVIGFIDKLPPEFGLHDYVDYDMMFEKSFIDAMKSVMAPMGWNTEERSSLESFFG